MIAKKLVELDETAHSVRRSFLGSIAGTLAMFAVVGVAGGYAVAERAKAQGAPVALVSLHAKLSPLIEQATPFVERAVALASEMARRMPMVSEPEDVVVRVIPPPPALVAPAIADTPNDAMTDGRATPAASAPVLAALEPMPVIAPPVAAAPVVASPVVAPVVAPPAPVAVEPAPAPVEPVIAQPQAQPEPPKVTASIAMPAPAAEFRAEPLPEARPLPQLAALPQPSVQPEKSQPLEAPAIIEADKTNDVVNTIETPQTVWVMLPQPKRVAAPPRSSVQPETIQPVETPTVVEADKTSDIVVNTIETPQTVWVMLPHPKPPPSPAQLLALHGPDYDKAERCLAQAIYFEARNEPVRGQMAVAQVVLNRVFSPYYPKDVCSVVYQNAHRHLSCQFTFACDGKPEAIRERGAWARAQRIARQSLGAEVWLPEVAKATHYHATYVRPNWIRDMRVMVRHGVHIFYRPRNWGDGSKELGWGTESAAEATTAATPTATAHQKKRKSS